LEGEPGCVLVSGSPSGSGVRLSEGLLPVAVEVGGVGKGETEEMVEQLE
jgi:hypothetical protein